MPERIRRRGLSGRGGGVDIEPGRTVPWLPAVFVLSRLLRRLLRRQTLRDERGFGAHCRVHAAPLVSQLVPAPLPVRLRGISLREQLIDFGGQHADADPHYRHQSRTNRGCTPRFDYTRAKGTAVQILV